MVGSHFELLKASMILFGISILFYFEKAHPTKSLSKPFAYSIGLR